MKKFNEQLIIYLQDKDLRYGQAVVNAIRDTHIEIYEELILSDNDCFYSDYKVIDMMDYIRKALSKKELHNDKTT